MLFLKKSSEYKLIYRDHKRARGSYFTILIQIREEETGPAFGIVTRKKVGNAVVRNKIKRRIKAYLRDISRQLPENLYAVILAGDEAGNLNYAQTVNDIAGCLRVVKPDFGEKLA